MAKCKICKANIPDGKEYCNNCQDKENLISNETYLDSLLNSVKNTAPAAESIYRKKNDSMSGNSQTNSSSKIETNDSVTSMELKEHDYHHDDAYSLDLEDLKDFDQFSIDDDLIDLQKDIVIRDDELFGEDLSDILSDKTSRQPEPTEDNTEIKEVETEYMKEDNVPKSREDKEFLYDTEQELTEQYATDIMNNPEQAYDYGDEELLKNSNIISKINDYQEDNLSSSVNSGINDYQADNSNSSDNSERNDYQKKNSSSSDNSVMNDYQEKNSSSSYNFERNDYQEDNLSSSDNSEMNDDQEDNFSSSDISEMNDDQEDYSNSSDNSVMNDDQEDYSSSSGYFERNDYQEDNSSSSNNSEMNDYQEDNSSSSDISERNDDQEDNLGFSNNSERNDYQVNNSSSSDNSEINDQQEDNASLSDNQNDNYNPEEIAEFEAEEDFDPDINDLLNSLDDFQPSGSDQPRNDTDLIKEEVNIEDTEEYEHIQEDDDILSLLNQISSDDPVAEDVKAINELLSANASEPQKKSSMPSDVGEVFSDALKVVTSLNDGNIAETELLGKIAEGKKGKKEKNNKKQKLSMKDSKKQKADKIASEDKPKEGFFKRLFGNVMDENAPDKDAADIQGEENAKDKKPAKKSKPSKGKKSTAAALEVETVEKGKGKGKPGKDKEADSKEEGSTDKKGKKGKKEKKKKSKEIIQVIDEIEEDEGRINRLGAAIIFLFFGLFALLLFVGTNVVSYTLSIQSATNYFDNQKYTQAYNEVYGIDIKDKDIAIYDKIMTVMFVNKQLNSYNNYYSLGQYPEALDSLLKGLKRYDKYIELATILGIKTDLDYVRNQILAELNNVYHLSEKDAMKINSYEDKSEYSMEVYDVVLENMSN
ncbi:MAG TPA: hypothetical protein VN258_00265 [Mobilitalea sp.]|nr:hypothetical protein [Mobilitalea sp.]